MTINVFKVGNRYLFKHYFENRKIFEKLEKYYVRHRYRFEIPSETYGAFKKELESEGYKLEEVEDPEPLCVVKPKYTEMKEILKKSVYKEVKKDDLIFVMKDKVAVEEAVQLGAKPLEETEYQLTQPR